MLWHLLWVMTLIKWLKQLVVVLPSSRVGCLLPLLLLPQCSQGIYFHLSLSLVLRLKMWIGQHILYGPLWHDLHGPLFTFFKIIFYIFHESEFIIFLNELLINTLRALINKIIFYNKKMNVFNKYLKGRGHNVFNALLRIFLISLCTYF